MFNGKTMIIHLIVGLIKKTWFKQVNLFQNQNIFEEEWKLN